MPEMRARVAVPCRKNKTHGIHYSGNALQRIVGITMPLQIESLLIYTAHHFITD